MPIKENRLPNNPLSGAELAQVTMNESEALLDSIKERVLSALDAKMRADDIFTGKYGHPRVAVSFSVKFQFSNIRIPKTEYAVTAGEGAPPLTPVEPEAEHVVIGMERKIEVDNPNLTRLDNALPFHGTNVVRPNPGENFGTIQTVEIPINPDDYAHVPRKEPVESDTSEALAEELKVPESRRLTPAKNRRAR